MRPLYYCRVKSKLELQTWRLLEKMPNLPKEETFPRLTIFSNELAVVEVPCELCCLPALGNDNRTPKSKCSSAVPAYWKDILMLTARKELYNSHCYMKLYKNVL